MRFGAARLRGTGILRRVMAVPRGGTTSTAAVRRAGTPGTVRHARTPSMVRGSHARQTSTRTANGWVTQLPTQRPAGCSPAERRRISPPHVQGYQQAPYSPCLTPARALAPAAPPVPRPSPPVSLVPVSRGWPGELHEEPVTDRHAARVPQLPGGRGEEGIRSVRTKVPRVRQAAGHARARAQSSSSWRVARAASSSSTVASRV